MVFNEDLLSLSTFDIIVKHINTQYEVESIFNNKLNSKLF